MRSQSKQNFKSVSINIHHLVEIMYDFIRKVTPSDDTLQNNNFIPAQISALSQEITEAVRVTEAVDIYSSSFGRDNACTHQKVTPSDDTFKIKNLIQPRNEITLQQTFKVRQNKCSSFGRDNACIQKSDNNEVLFNHQ